MIGWLRTKIPWDIALKTIIWLLSAMILGLFDLYTFRFDPRRFLNSDYLSNVGIMISLGLFIFVFRLVEYTIKLKEQDTENIKLEKKLNSYVNGENKLKHIILFLLFENTERRIIAYKTKKQKQISNLLDRLTPKEMEDYTSKNLDKKYPKVRKLIVLEEKLSKEYITKHKEHLKVKFIKITPSFITSGFNDKNTKTGNMNPSKKSKIVFIDNVYNFTLPTIFMMFIIGSILVANEVDVWAIVLIVSLKLLLLLFQYWNATRYAPTYLGQTWIHDLHLRKILWEKYFTWITQKKGGAE